MGHRLFECPSCANKGRDGCPQGQATQGRQVQQGGGQHPNRFYALHDRQDVEESTDMVMGILQVFDYALLDLDANLPFVTPYISTRFDMSLKILLKPFFFISMLVIWSYLRESIEIIPCQSYIK